MKRPLIVLALLLASAAPAPARQFEADAFAGPSTRVDTIVILAQRRRGIQPAQPCSDAVFVRRAYLDVIGTLPEPREVRAFLDDTKPGKRDALIDALFEREEFADYWALKWCDLLRVKSEFPINLWPNAVQAYQRWIHDALREHRPYDEFARELLTASGSNFREPQVNFYRALQGRTPAAIAAAVALTFMGERIERWPEPRRTNLAAFFTRVAYKQTGEWKEEIVFADPAPFEPFEALLPDGSAVRIAPPDDPRRVFADWLLDPRNDSFARAFVNRAWSWFFGRGIVHEPDDLRPDNPPAIPELLDFLAREFVKSRYDVRHLFRLILQSRTYQQSPIPRGDLATAEAMFACYPVRRLDAEVLADALAWLAGTEPAYSSTIPEPFTFIPASNRTITLADGSITSPFLDMFGRPARDTGLESERNNQCTDAQRLYLLNATEVQRGIERSPRLRAVLAAGRGQLAETVRGTYLLLLAREPLASEVAEAEVYFRTPGRVVREALADLVWALINSKEFLFRH